MNEIIEKIRKKQRLHRIILMSISVICNAVLYSLFLLPLNLVTGSIGGIATITKYVYGINPSIMLLLLTIACSIFSLMYLGVKRTLGTLIASLAYPLLVELTSFLNGVIVITNPDDMFLVVIFAGVLSGISNGLMYKTGYSNGGFPVISQYLYEEYKISINKSSLIINMSIVFLGGFFFGSANVMYALIFLYVNDVVMKKVLLGINNNKAFYIITNEEEKTKELLVKDLNHNITVFDVKGGIFERKRKIILSVIPTSEYFKVTELIKEIDQDAFFIVTDSYEVNGAK